MTGSSLSLDERAELERLRADVSKLHTERARPARRSHAGWRAPALRISAVSLAALLFVFWGRPTAAVVVVIAILLLVVLGLIELIGSRPPAQPATAAHP